MPSSEPTVMVTIVGSATPSVVLPRGHARMVELTPRIQRLIDRGFVIVTHRHEIGGSRPAQKPTQDSSEGIPPEPPETVEEPSQGEADDA